MNPKSNTLNNLYIEFGSSDPKAVKNNTNLLLFALENNVSHKLLLTKSDWLYLLSNSDLTRRNSQGYQASDLVLFYNSENELYFNEKKWDILMPSVDPHYVCTQGFTPLTALLSTYSEQCHDISQKHIKYLLGISSFERGGQQNMNPLEYALIYNKKTDWLSYENWETLYSKCDFDLKKIDIKFPPQEVNAIMARKEIFQIQREQRLLHAQLVIAKNPIKEQVSALSNFKL